MKNGIKTTEFWLSLVAVFGLILGAIWGAIPTEIVAKYSVYIIAAYTIGRAIAKLTPNTNDDKIFEAIDEKIMKYFKSSDAKKN